MNTAIVPVSGFNFAIASNRILSENIICEVENVLKH